MKTLAILSLGLLALAGLSTTAYAADGQFKLAPYVGFDLTHNSVNYNDDYSGVNLNDLLNDNINGINLHVGNRFNKYVGAEFGLFRTENADKTIGASTTHVRLQGATLDALGYLPLDEKDSVDLIGTAGVTWTKAKLQLNVPGFGAANDDDSEIGARVGAGAQVNLTDRINARALVRYQTADFSGFANNEVTYSLGLNYSF